MDLVKVENVYKAYGENQVLSDVSLSVKEGEVLAIIGPSGSGKSTLLRCINALSKIDSGRIEVAGQTLVDTQNGVPVYKKGEELRKIRTSMGQVFQQFNLFPHYTVLSNITKALTVVMGQPKEQAEKIAYDLLDKMSLLDKADAYPGELSGGQQQRVSVARALALNPKVMMFDEPTSALDPELTGEVLKVLKELAGERMTMIIVTHEISFASQVAGTMLFLREGKVAAYGPTAQILSSAQQNPYLKSFLQNFER